MTGRILDLGVANALIAAFGCGLLPALRLARVRGDLIRRLPLGYAVGLASVGILSADLAVCSIAVGRLVLWLLAAGSLTGGLWALRREPHRGPRLPRIREVPALAVLGVITAFAVPFARLFAVKPLLEWDGWAIWATRAEALYDFGSTNNPVFRSPLYPALQHPLLLPSLEALDFRFMGRFDGTLVHLQLLGLAVGFVGGAWCLLGSRTRSFLLAATLLAVVTAPGFLDQLQTNYADIPLAMFVALGVAALAAWLRTGTGGLLPAAALFLAAGALTKNEGECFAFTALLAALIVSRSGQRRPLVTAFAAVLAADLPWRIWLQVNHVKIAQYSLANLFSIGYLRAHAERVEPVARELERQIFSGGWSYLVPLAISGLLGSLLLGRVRPALFSTCWLLLSFAGLVAIYWISTNPLESNLSNSSNRTIDSLVLGAALLCPVLLSPESSTHEASTEGGSAWAVPQPPSSSPLQPPAGRRQRLLGGLECAAQPSGQRSE